MAQQLEPNVVLRLQRRTRVGHNVWPTIAALSFRCLEPKDIPSLGMQMFEEAQITLFLLNGRASLCKDMERIKRSAMHHRLNLCRGHVEISGLAGCRWGESQGRVVYSGGAGGAGVEGVDDTVALWRPACANW